MKSFDDLNKKIDKYYEGSLDGNTSEELEIKNALDRMSSIKDIENNISIFVDVSSVVEKGQEIRFNKKLRQDTFKFLTLAILIAILFGFMYTKVSFPVIMASQFGMLVGLLILNFILLKKRVRRDA